MLNDEFVHAYPINGVGFCQDLTYQYVIENDTYGITGIPTTIGGCGGVERAGLRASTQIVYPSSGRENA